MANRDEEDASPLLTLDAQKTDSVFLAGPKPRAPPLTLAPAVAVDYGEKGSAKWTAEGVPVAQTHGSVVGEPLLRDQWDSGLFCCLGRNDEFCSSDLEVCLLGSFAPCVLFGGNAERLGSGPGSFTHSCFTYAGLYLLGNCLFGLNCLAPWISYPSRAAIRRRFNLEVLKGLGTKEKRGYGALQQFLVHWHGRPKTDCSWITEEHLLKTHPDIYQHLTGAYSSGDEIFPPGEN